VSYWLLLLLLAVIIVIIVKNTPYTRVVVSLRNRNDNKRETQTSSGLPACLPTMM
jgi:hypothetical protein